MSLFYSFLISVGVYFNIVTIPIEFLENKEWAQLNNEFDQPPQFETNETLFMIDDETMKKNNTIVFNSFVLQYDKYPKTEISLLLGRNSLFDKSARINVPPRYIPPTEHLHKSAMNLCETQTEQWQPQAAKNDSRWIVVVNQDDFKQNIAVEYCMHPTNLPLNLQKSSIRNDTPNINNLKCRQTYTTIYLVVFMNSLFHQYEFPYPSACEAYYG